MKNKKFIGTQSIKTLVNTSKFRFIRHTLKRASDDYA